MSSEKYADEECKILRSQRVYIRDEASKMYAQMRKSWERFARGVIPRASQRGKL